MTGQFNTPRSLTVLPGVCPIAPTTLCGNLSEARVRNTSFPSPVDLYRSFNQVPYPISGIFEHAPLAVN